MAPISDFRNPDFVQTPPINPHIRWPLLARGIKAAGFGIVRSLTIIGCVSAVICYQGPNPALIPLAKSRTEDPFPHQNSICFYACFRSNKNKKKWSQGLQKTRKIYTGPKITPKSMKILFQTTSCPSCCSHGPPRWSRGAKMAPGGASEVPE